MNKHALILSDYFKLQFKSIYYAGICVEKFIDCAVRIFSVASGDLLTALKCSTPTGQ